MTDNTEAAPTTITQHLAAETAALRYVCEFLLGQLLVRLPQPLDTLRQIQGHLRLQLSDDLARGLREKSLRTNTEETRLAVEAALATLFDRVASQLDQERPGPTPH